MRHCRRFWSKILLADESRSDFEAIRQMMVGDVQPATNIE
jgi:hypothetical protein